MVGVHCCVRACAETSTLASTEVIGNLGSVLLGKGTCSTFSSLLVRLSEVLELAIRRVKTRWLARGACLVLLLHLASLLDHWSDIVVLLSVARVTLEASHIDIVHTSLLLDEHI